MALPHLDPKVLAGLSQELETALEIGLRSNEREKSAKRINLILHGLARKLGISGEVQMFGSFSNGFKTGTSDLDVVLVGSTENESTISILGKFAAQLADLGFENITKIFQANIPLLKLSDMKSNMEVDFCINNELGVRNSLLLNTYCKYDYRVLQLGRLVKDWAKRHELVGTADGCLNSYAYMLLVIFFLQSVQPAVVPNLQLMDCESHPVSDRKWGGEDIWETKFCQDIDNIPKSTNEMSLGELLIRFFHFYTRDFNWRLHAVCMRLHRPGSVIDKYSLQLPTNDEQWYVEDPFDLKHNLAGKCSRAGKNRILEEMNNSLNTLSTGSPWSHAFPASTSTDYFMKCRISQAVTPQALLEEFEEFNLVKLHFPKPDGSIRMPTAFLQFGDATSRRRAHRKNEKYIADCQLQLHYSTQHSLAEAVTQGFFSTYEMASYRMQRQVLAARVQSIQMQPEISGPPGLTQQPMPMAGYQDIMTPEAGLYPLYGPPPPPPPPLPQQTPMMWEQQQQQKQVQEKQKLQSMQQMHHMQQLQQRQMQQKVDVRPQSAQMAVLYNSKQGQQRQWQQQQQPQQVWPQHQLQMAQASMATPQAQQLPLQQTQQKKTAAEKEEEKKEKKAAKKTTTVTVKAVEVAAASTKAKVAATAAPTVPSANKMSKHGTSAGHLAAESNGSGNGWLEVKVTNNIPQEEGSVFTNEQMDKILELQTFFQKFRSVDKRVTRTEVRLEVELKDDRVKQNGHKSTPLFNPEQRQLLQDLRQRFVESK